MNDLVQRLRVIAHAIAAHDMSELSMCVPAEPDRDADLVVMRAANLIESLRQQLAECERERDELKTWLEDQVCEAKDFAYKLEGKTVELATVTKERDELVEALKQFAECDLNDDNCASLEVATRRIRSLAQAALAKLGADKMGEV